MKADKVAIPSDGSFQDEPRVLSDDDLAKVLPDSVRQHAAIILRAVNLASGTVLSEEYPEEPESGDETGESYEALFVKTQAALADVSAETLAEAMAPFLTIEMQRNLERVPNPYFLPKCRERMEQMRQEPVIRESLDQLRALLGAETLEMDSIQKLFLAVGDERLLEEALGSELLKYFNSRISHCEGRPNIFPAVAEEKDLYLYLYYELHRAEPEMDAVIIDLIRNGFFELKTLNLLTTHLFNAPEFAYLLRSNPFIPNATLRKNIGVIGKTWGKQSFSYHLLNYFLFDKDRWSLVKQFGKLNPDSQEDMDRLRERVYLMDRNEFKKRY